MYTVHHADNLSSPYTPSESSLQHHTSPLTSHYALSLHNSHSYFTDNIYVCLSLSNKYAESITYQKKKKKKSMLRAFPNPFWVYSLFYLFKKSLFYFNYPLLQNISHSIFYFTIHHIKIL
jgi:hypothetical protein